MLTKPLIYVQEQNYFQTQYPNVFEKYKLPNVNKEEIIAAWNTTPMQFWQNQLNFAVWWAIKPRIAALLPVSCVLPDS